MPVPRFLLPCGCSGSVLGLPLCGAAPSQPGSQRRLEAAAAWRLQRTPAQAFPPNAAHQRNKGKQEARSKRLNATQAFSLSGLWFPLPLVLTGASILAQIPSTVAVLGQRQNVARTLRNPPPERFLPV